MVDPIDEVRLMPKPCNLRVLLLQPLQLCWHLRGCHCCCLVSSSGSLVALHLAWLSCTAASAAIRQHMWLLC